MDGLKVARNLAIWFHRSFGENINNFKPGAFVPPQDPSEQLRALQSELSRDIEL
jgi:type I restriction enzyme R subunit